MTNFKLNIGCGNRTPQGWVNVDNSFGARMSKIPLWNSINSMFGFLDISWDPTIVLQDIRKPLRWKDNTIDIIYCSHTLEHLSKQEGEFFLKECYRIIKPKGIIRIVVPDMKYYAREYMNGGITADDMLDCLGVHTKQENDTSLKRTWAKFFRYPHKCMYDEKVLIEKMTDVGFDMHGQKPFVSHIDDIAAIELSERTEHAVIVEGTK